VDRFSNFFHQVIRKKILYVHIIKISTSPAYMLLHYLVKIKNPKMLLTLTSSQQTVSTCSWGHFQDLIWHLTVVRQTVSRLLTLTDWLTFWSLSDLIQLNIVASRRFFFTMIIFAPSSFFLGHTLYVVIDRIWGVSSHYVGAVYGNTFIGVI